MYLTNDAPFLVVKDGKGGKRREVMISPILRAILKKFIRGMEPGPVFRPQRGERYTGNGLWRVWAVACAGAGILPRSIHKARHFYGQKQYEATNDLRFVQKQLGHSRIVTTQVYVEISNTKAAENLVGLDKVLRV